MLNQRCLEKAALLGLMGSFALGAACSSQNSDKTPDTSARDASPVPDASPDGSPDGVVTTGPIWTDQSQLIDIGCFAFFEGSKRIRATRDQLSAQQLDILSGMKMISPQPYCYADSNSCSVAITAADGTVASYTTEQMDSGCGKTQPVLSYATFAPFLETVPCLAGKEGQYGTSDGGPALPMITPDPRCYNGIFTGGPGTTQRRLAVDDSSIARHLELDLCNDGHRTPALAHPQLLAPDGTSPLPVVWVAELTDPGADGTCYRADYTFPGAGAYVLSIDIDAGFTPGDFLLRFY